MISLSKWATRSSRILEKSAQPVWRGHSAKGEASPKSTAFDRKTEGRTSCVPSTSRQPPSVSSVSLRLLRMQVKIGVSRSV